MVRNIMAYSCNEILCSHIKGWFKPVLIDMTDWYNITLHEKKIKTINNTQ